MPPPSQKSQSMSTGNENIRWCYKEDPRIILYQLTPRITPGVLHLFPNDAYVSPSASSLLSSAGLACPRTECVCPELHHPFRLAGDSFTVCICSYMRVNHRYLKSQNTVSNTSRAQRMGYAWSAASEVQHKIDPATGYPAGTSLYLEILDSMPKTE